jgi:hypothetical protein
VRAAIFSRIAGGDCERQNWKMSLGKAKVIFSLFWGEGQAPNAPFSCALLVDFLKLGPLLSPSNSSTTVDFRNLPSEMNA